MFSTCVRVFFFTLLPRQFILTSSDWCESPFIIYRSQVCMGEHHIISLLRFYLLYYKNNLCVIIIIESPSERIYLSLPLWFQVYNNRFQFPTVKNKIKHKGRKLDQNRNIYFNRFRPNKPDRHDYTFTCKFIIFRFSRDF